MGEIESVPHTDFLDKKLLFLAGAFILLIVSIISIKVISSHSKGQIKFKEEATDSANLLAITTVKVDVSGAVESPGVYTLSPESRIQDALLAAGGLSLIADREWVAKYLNLAQKALDGSKIYIPAKNEIKDINNTQNNTLGTTTVQKPLININTSSKAELDTLPGVGVVTAEKIITNRQYSDKQDLLTKKVVNKSTYEKIKDLITLY